MSHLEIFAGTVNFDFCSYCSGYRSIRIEFYCRKSKEPEKCITASVCLLPVQFLLVIVLSNTIRAQILNRIIFPCVFSYFHYGTKLDLFGKITRATLSWFSYNRSRAVTTQRKCSKTSTKIIRLNLSSYGIAPGSYGITTYLFPIRFFHCISTVYLYLDVQWTWHYYLSIGYLKVDIQWITIWRNVNGCP